jgi:tryptophan-rich sensory protein
VKKNFSIVFLILVLVDFLYMLLRHRFGPTLYFIDIFLLLIAAFLSFLMPKSRAKVITMTLSFVCLLAFAVFTVWAINGLNNLQ